MLTPAQNEVVEAVNRGSNVFVTGPGGVGKSTIINHVRENRAQRFVGVTASTGAAAVLIGGTTVHSLLGIGLARESVQELTRKIRMSRAKLTWLNLELLIIDEISMLNAETLDKIEEIARVIRNSKKPFGGIQLLLSGDFLQLPPVTGSFCFESPTWTRLNLETFHLVESKRQIDKTFSDILNRARFGSITDDDLEVMKNCDVAKKGPIVPTKLYCVNVDVDRINSSQLTELEGKVYSYDIEIVSPFPLDHAKHCNASTEVRLAVGAQVMLLVNMDIAVGLVNGSRGVIERFSTNGLPMVRFARTIDTAIEIDFHEWKVQDPKGKVIAQIFQIPLKLAYAITIHKSQGCTIDCAEIDLAGSFACGQAYVALSRVRDIESFKIVNVGKKSFTANGKAVEFYRSLE